MNTQPNAIPAGELKANGFFRPVLTHAFVTQPVQPLVRKQDIGVIDFYPNRPNQPQWNPQ